MFYADLVVSLEGTNNYPTMQQRLRHHLFQVGHAHDVELGREREGQWEPVALAALAVSGQRVAQGASADAQAAVGDQDNLQAPGTRHTIPAAPGTPTPTHRRSLPAPTGLPPPSWAKEKLKIEPS